MRKALVGAVLALALGFTVGPAAAHVHDGYVNDGDEGSFVRGPHSRHFYVTSVQDTQTDGHCVYWWARVDGVVNTNDYSCGGFDFSEYEVVTITRIETQRCITGHWDCDGYALVFI